MKIMFWMKNGYRRKTRAYVIAERIIKETENTIRIQIYGDGKMSIRRRDLSSIEDDE